MAQVTPKDVVSDIDFDIVGPPGQIDVTIGSPDPASGTIPIEVKGKSLSSSEGGDTAIRAKYTGEVINSVQVVVVVPFYLKTPLSYLDKDGFPPPINIAANSGTFPPNHQYHYPEFYLTTVYGWYLAVEVLDQFGHGLPNFYDGSPIVENGAPLNTVLDSSQFMDPAQVVSDQYTTTTDPSVVAQWLNGTQIGRFPPGHNTFSPDFLFNVGGHNLTPILKRTYESWDTDKRVKFTNFQ